MKDRTIAIACETNNIDSTIAYRPGHCNYFCICKSGKEPYFLINPAQNANNAYGLIAMNSLIKEEVNLIISRFFGPRFSEIASQNNIQLLNPPVDIHSISEIIEALNLK